MTKYTVWLWPGFGAELKPFIVEASYEQEALETVGESLKGTGFTISGNGSEVSLSNVWAFCGTFPETARPFQAIEASLRTCLKTRVKYSFRSQKETCSARSPINELDRRR